MKDVCIGTGTEFTFGAWVSSWPGNEDNVCGYSKIVGTVEK